jgi:AcrR family transcriptional regulator
VTLQPSEEPVKRRYNAPRRQAQAQETRNAILEAAMELFNIHGFTGTTVSQVAEKASVSEQTVYNVFGDKIGLLHAAAMHAIDTGAGDPEVDLIEALRAEPDPMERIRLAARATREIWESGAFELEQMVFSPEVKDPRLIDLADRTLAHTLASTRTMVEILYPDEIRRPGFEPEDIAIYFTAADTAATVSKLQRLGWTLEEYENWIVQLLAVFLDPDWVAQNGPSWGRAGGP